MEMQHECGCAIKLPKQNHTRTCFPGMPAMPRGRTLRLSTALLVAAVHEDADGSATATRMRTAGRRRSTASQYWSTHLCTMTSHAMHDVVDEDCWQDQFRHRCVTETLTESAGAMFVTSTE